MGFAVEGKLVSVRADPIGSKKTLYPVTQDALFIVPAPPGPVYGPVAGRAPGIEGETGRTRVAAADKRAAVKMSIVGSEACAGIGCFLKEGPAGICRFIR